MNGESLFPKGSHYLLENNDRGSHYLLVKNDRGSFFPGSHFSRLHRTPPYRLNLTEERMKIMPLCRQYVFKNKIFFRNQYGIIGPNNLDVLFILVYSSMVRFIREGSEIDFGEKRHLDRRLY